MPDGKDRLWWRWLDPSRRDPGLLAVWILSAGFSLPLFADAQPGTGATPDSPSEADEWVLGMETLHRLDHLPTLRKSVRVGSVSSYDRTGGNDDGFSGAHSFVRRDGDGLVIAELTGPGIIYRIWTPTPTDDLVEFFFDGESTPRLALPFRDLFSGSHEPFVRPLVGSGAGGFYAYVPIPFRTSCSIRIRAERVQFYQINYAIYPEDAPVYTFSPESGADDLADRERASTLWEAAGTDVSAYGLSDPGQGQWLQRHHVLEPGTAWTLFETHQPGRIAGIRISPASALAGTGRNLTLRATWDDDPVPAILCPAGDLFGYAWGRPAMTSLLVGTHEDQAYLYFPMPFDQSARIELVSEDASGVPIEVHAEVRFSPQPRRPTEGKFYAVWRRENPTQAGQPFTFLDTEGRGHLVGCIQQAQGLDTGETPFFEGDDQTTIDGVLAIHGTGSEDFYNGGWYDVPGRWDRPRSFPLSGCLGYQKHLGRTGGYRLMLGDAYAYRSSILQTIEHAPTGNELVNDYCGVTFLYAEPRPTGTFSLPEVSRRAVVNPTRLVFAAWWNLPIPAWSFERARLIRLKEDLQGSEARFLSLQAEGAEWYGPPFISFVCDVPAAGPYQVLIRAARGPAQGTVQLFHDNLPAGNPISLFSEERHQGDPLLAGTLLMKQGANELVFKILDPAPGRNDLRFDLRDIILERAGSPAPPGD